MGGMARGIPGGGATAQTMAGMATAMQQMQAAQITMGGTAGMTTEAPSEQLKLSGQVADEIKKGKLVIKKIDWVHGAPTVSPSTMQGFLDVMMSVGQAIKAAGGNYRVDVYMDKKYSDEDRAALGVQRMSLIEAARQRSGPAPRAVVVGKVDKDKEQRVGIGREKRVQP